MSFKRILVIIAAGALCVSSLACGGAAEQPAATNGNVAVTNAGTQPTSTTKILKRNEPGPDNSTITVRQHENGEVVTVRRWDDGPVRKVTKRERDGQTQQVRVVTREGAVYRVDDRNAVEHALDWTGAQLADVAKKTGKAVDATAEEVGDKAEDVGEEAADKAEDVKDATVKGAKTVGSEAADKAEDVKDATVKGAKKAADKAEDVGDAAAKGAKKAGEALKP